MGIHSFGMGGSMKKGFWLVMLLACFMTPRLVAAADAPAMGEAPVAPAPLDVVTLKDGSVLYGEVIEMSGGVLSIKTAAAADNIVKMKLPAASCGVSCEILRSHYPPSPRLWRVLLAFIPVASYGVFGEGE